MVKEAYRLSLLRYTDTGVLDSGFSGEGVSLLPTIMDFPEAMTLDADGYFLLGGHIYDQGSQRWVAALVGLTPSGLLDAAFGPGGESSRRRLATTMRARRRLQFRRRERSLLQEARKWTAVPNPLHSCAIPPQEL